MPPAPKKRLLDLLRDEPAVQTPARKNFAEFTIEKDEIFEALEQGWALKHIYMVLIKAGRITMAYSVLARHVKAARNSLPLPKSIPGSRKAPSNAGFHHNPTPKKEDLI